MLRLLLAAALLAAPARAEPSALHEAEVILDKLGGEPRVEVRYRLADQAQALCEKAAAERPRDPAPHLCIARALQVADPAHPESCRKGACERAVDELQRARDVDKNGIEAERVASDLGIVFSRLGRFPEALAQYDVALRLVESERSTQSLDGSNKSVLYGNSAETLMAMGRLGEAIERYRQAEDASATGSIEWKLAMWGLGVALDRDEQVEKSREAIGRAMDKDPTMAHLSDDSVFFEPAGDKLYYLALGHEQAGERKEAMALWNEFLQTLPRSPWARRARGHIEALKKGPPEPHLGPPVEVFVGNAISIRPLRTPAQLNAVLRDHDDDLRTCYARSLRQGVARAKLQGDIRITIEILPWGRPIFDVRLEEASIGDRTLVQCVEDVVVHWRFPAVDSQEPELVSIPIHFGKLP